jgi:hypothetical protein
MPSNVPLAPPPPRRRFKLWSILLIAAICLTMLTIGFYTVEKVRGRAAWLGYEKEAKARGVKLDFAAFNPPPVPDAENFASIPIFDAAFRAADAGQSAPDPLKLPSSPSGQMPGFSDPARQQTVDLVAWQEYFVAVKLLPAAGDNAARDVLQALDNFAAKPLAQLREASLRPRCRFPVRWERTYAAALPHCGILHNAAKLYAMRVSAHLALGDSAAAGEDFRAGLRLATATAEEPTVIPGLVRVAIFATMTNALWDGLAGHRWAEPELRKIETDLAAFDWLKDYSFAMSSERTGVNAMMDAVIADASLLAGVSTSLETGRSFFRIYPIGWHYQSKVRLNRFFDELSLRVDPAQRRFFGEAPVLSSPDNLRTPPKKIYYLLFGIVAPVFEGIEKRFAQAATMTDHARLACALERFRLAHQAFPATLAELTPAFIPAVPIEVVNGEPYHYRRTEDGSFLLYSVGSDLRDDSGILAPAVTASKQLDWIWRYPEQAPRK